MIIEPFELKGKTIKDCYATNIGKPFNKEQELTIEFTDGTKVMIFGVYGMDELSGDEIFAGEMRIQTV